MIREEEAGVFFLLLLYIMWDGMARGWESKSIETQQEEASRDKVRGGPMPTAEEREAASVRHTLELARSKVAADLGRATTPAHRQMLQRALEDLDRRIADR